MNTDPLVPALQNALPSKYTPWIALASLCIPHLTRALYALYSGRGLVGMVHGVFFGTNTPNNLVANVRGNADAILKTAKAVVEVAGDPGHAITNQVIAPIQNQPKLTV